MKYTALTLVTFGAHLFYTNALPVDSDDVTRSVETEEEDSLAVRENPLHTNENPLHTNEWEDEEEDSSPSISRRTDGVDRIAEEAEIWRAYLEHNREKLEAQWAAEDEEQEQEDQDQDEDDTDSDTTQGEEAHQDKIGSKNKRLSGHELSQSVPWGDLDRADHYDNGDFHGISSEGSSLMGMIGKEKNKRLSGHESSHSVPWNDLDGKGQQGPAAGQDHVGGSKTKRLSGHELSQSVPWGDLDGADHYDGSNGDFHGISSEDSSLMGMIGKEKNKRISGSKSSHLIPWGGHRGGASRGRKGGKNGVNRGHIRVGGNGAAFSMIGRGEEEQVEEEFEEEEEIEKRGTTTPPNCSAGQATYKYAVRQAIGKLSWWPLHVGAGPHRCKVVACHEGSAVRICNDGKSGKSIPSSLVKNMANKIVDTCDLGGHSKTRGQVFNEEHRFNVMIGRAQC